MQSGGYPEVRSTQTNLSDETVVTAAVGHGSLTQRHVYILLLLLFSFIYFF